MKKKPKGKIAVQIPQNAFSLNLLTVLHITWESDVPSSITSGRPFHALSYRFSGDAHYKFCDKELDVHAGQLIFVPKGVTYEISHTPSELVVIHFDCDVPLGCGEIEICELDKRFPLQHFFSEIIQCWHGLQFGGTYRANALLYELLGALCSEHIMRLTPTNAERLSDTLAYIRRNIGDSDLSVSELANRFGTSETFFRRAFENAVGMSPAKYIANIRLELAVNLLQTGYYSVSETAERCGFTDTKYFSRFIKKQTGKTPSDYKLD